MRYHEHENAIDEEGLILAVEELRMRAENSPIIVEGMKDVEALRNIGITENIIPLNRGKSIIDFCTDLSVRYDEAVILTDWDGKGNHLCHLLKKGLRACGMGFDTRVRGRLASSVRKEIKDVQSLHNMLVRNHPGLLPLILNQRVSGGSA